MICQNILLLNFLWDVNIIRGLEVRIMRKGRAIGVSTSWLHHKGRNKHHFEHWVDYSLDKEHVIMGAQMPRKYVAEMVMDRISASRNYLGDAYTDSQPLEYFLKSKEKLWFIHPQTKKELEGLLRILNDHGEEKLLRYIRRVYLKNRPKEARY